MSTDQKRDETDEQKPHAGEGGASVDAEGGDADVDQQDAGPVVAAEGGEGIEGSSDVPRNRAERRAAEKAERRGIATAPSGRTIVRPPRTPARTAPVTEDVPSWARGFVETLSRHRRAMAITAGAVVLVAGAAVGVTLYREQRFGKAAGLFNDAVEIQLAPIRAADLPPDPARRGPTYPDHAARSRAALEAFRRVGQQYPDAPITPVARLSEATSLFDLGRYAEAKRLYESLLGANLAGLEPRVLEGLGFTLEALNDLPGALRRFEELGRLDSARWRDTAQYHQARVLNRQGQTARSKELLRGILERVGRTRPDDPSGAGGNASMIENARVLLREIDPQDPLARQQEMPTDPAAIMRMLQQRSGGNLNVPPTGSPGGE